MRKYSVNQSPTMVVLRIVGDMMHLASIFILLAKIIKTRSAAGVSFKSQLLYLVVFIARYLDIFFAYVSIYNSTMKMFFIASSAYIVYLMKVKFKATWEVQQDSFKAEYLVLGACLMGLVTTREYTAPEMLWTFSIWLESVAIVPQITMLARAGVDTRITLYYLVALGGYRAMYLLNWVGRWWSRDMWDWVAVTAGVVQTVIYGDFFHVYYTKVTKGPKYRLPQ